MDDEESLTKSSRPNHREGIPHQLKWLVFILSGLFLAFLILVVVTMVRQTNTTDPNCESKEETKIRNVIFMIGDGFGPSQAALAREYKRYKNILPFTLNLDRLQVGSARTYSSSSRITDSAAAATSMASGKKTTNAFVGVDPSGRPLKLITEAAKEAGYRVGLVTNSNLYSATPAGFSAHVTNRDQAHEIAAQQLEQNFDVLLGGGMAVYQSLFANWTAKGYQIVSSSTEFTEVSRVPVLGIFSPAAMDFVIDRDATSNQPPLPLMAQHTLELLNKNNDKGFFAMIEGDNIDSASHMNDAPSVLREVLEFDETVSVVLDFAKKNPGTAVIITADHDCGGMALGDTTHPNLTLSTWLPDVLEKVQKSVMFMAKSLLTVNDIRAIVKTHADVTLTDDEVTNINGLFQTGMATGKFSPLLGAIGSAISARAAIGWTSIEHTAVDVNLYLSGDVSADAPRGNVENTDLAHYAAKLLGLKL